MPQFTNHRIVPFSPDQMFDLVADVARYPEFLPLCESLAILTRAPDGPGSERIVARMTVGYGLLRETFTVEVRLFRSEHRIAVRYLEGPFRRLDNAWAFKPQATGPHPTRPRATGCAIDFFIAYEFRSLPLQMLMGAVFDRAFRRFAEAFELRAAEVYGKPSA